MRNLSKAEEIAEREAEAICSDCGLYVYDVEYKKEGGENVSVNFGCKKITVYDEYGNASEMQSDSGIYSFNLTQSTVYATGNFSEFKKN